MPSIKRFFKLIVNSCFDLLPILVVVLVFQLLVIQQPIPNVADLIAGCLFVVLGLTFFMLGLEQSLFPIGESMANAFARKGSVFWLLLFAFCLGFGSAVAEPSLIAVAQKAADIAGAAHFIENNLEAKSYYALTLRLTVAAAVGMAIVIGVLRIVIGWPLHYFIIGGYSIVTILAPFRSGRNCRNCL